MQKIIVVCIGLIALQLAACSEKKPTTLKEVSIHILAIETTDAIVKVKLETKPGLSEYALAWKGVSESAKIVEALSNELKSESRPKLQVEFVAELVDKYNKTSTEPILAMTWKRSELEKMAWQPSPTPWDVLRLVDDVRYFNRGGEVSMAAYCAEDSQQKYAGDFCRKFAMTAR